MKKRFYLLTLLFLSPISSSVLLNDKTCDPGGLNPFPYSGIRFSKRNTIDWRGRTESNIIISACHKGKNIANIKDKVSEREVNVQWNDTICILVDKPATAATLFQKLVYSVAPEGKTFSIDLSEDWASLQESGKTTIKCFRLVRSKAYVQRKMPVFRPYALIGGIFECEAPVTLNGARMVRIENAPCLNRTPIAPVYADNIGYQSLNLVLPDARIQYTVPFLYTPNNFLGMDKVSIGKPWYEAIDILEHYDDHGGGVINRSFTKALNSLVWDKSELRKVEKSFAKKVQALANKTVIARKGITDKSKVGKELSRLKQARIFEILYESLSSTQQAAFLVYNLGKKRLKGVDLNAYLDGHGMAHKQGQTS